MLLAATNTCEPALNRLYAGEHPGIPHRQAAMPAMRAAEKTVKSLLEAPAYGQPLRLAGRLLRHLGPSRYLFADETGEITTRISRTVSGDISLFRNERIEIEGELKRTVSGEHLLRVQALKRPFLQAG